MIYNELKQRGTDDFPIELYQIDRDQSRYEMAAHWHGELEIIRVLRGVLHVKLNNNTYTVRENGIVFVNPETVHQAMPEDCVYECIVFHPDCLPAPVQGANYFIECLKNHEYALLEHHAQPLPALAAAVDCLFGAMAQPSSGYKFKVVGALYQLFGVLVDEHLYNATESASLAADKNVPKLKAVLAFIRSHYDSAITLHDMAGVAGMSSKYFCYFFKEMTAKTPVEYLTNYRIEKASRKLLHSDLSVTAVAYACGFNDLSYFIKTFKQIKGVTPAQYRKESQR